MKKTEWDELKKKEEAGKIMRMYDELDLEKQVEEQYKRGKTCKKKKTNSS